jgi:hypothetical protein
MRHVHEWPPMQQGEAKKASTRHLWNYVQQHGRWVETLYPGADNYLAINRANSARAELNRRINTRDNALNRN